MKTIYRGTKAVNIFTVTDLANQTGFTAVALWQRIHKQSTLPLPEIQVELRRYYSEKKFNELKNMLISERNTNGSKTLSR